MTAERLGSRRRNSLRNSGGLCGPNHAEDRRDWWAVFRESGLIGGNHGRLSRFGVELDDLAFGSE